MSVSNNDDMRQMTTLGRNIEESSFAIVDKEAGAHNYSSSEWEIVRRVIHATADFEFKKLVCFSSNDRAITDGIDAIKNGANVVVDVKMIEVGVNANRLAVYGSKIYSYISDEDVIASAKAKNSTRAIEAMQKAKKLDKLNGAIIAIGNAPTALIEISKMIENNEIRPALVLGVPVGFVSAAESKEKLMQTDANYIVTRGRKGGSPIAVAILHALLLLTKKLEENT